MLRPPRAPSRRSPAGEHRDVSRGSPQRGSLEAHAGLRGAAELALRSGARFYRSASAFPPASGSGPAAAGQMVLSVGEPLTAAELRLRAADGRPFDASVQPRIGCVTRRTSQRSVSLSRPSGPEVHLELGARNVRRPSLPSAGRPPGSFRPLRSPFGVAHGGAGERRRLVSWRRSQIVQQVYQQEKGWVANADASFRSRRFRIADIELVSGAPRRRRGWGGAPQPGAPASSCRRLRRTRDRRRRDLAHLTALRTFARWGG